MKQVLVVYGKHYASDHVALDWIERGATVIEAFGAQDLQALETSLPDGQIVLRTNNEHVINLVRVLMAEKKLESAEILAYGPAIDPYFRLALRVQPDGTVRGWPYHFLGEALDLSTRLLKAQKLHR